ncbi:class I SAM-dependent methyltransferase [Patescibacteria group bacterium]
MNIISNILYFFIRKILPGFKINRSDLVLDIGSGDKPFWRADVYVDKLSLDNSQRTTGEKTIHGIGLFIDSDVINLPFKDKVFDFSFCSHLLEHVEDPALVIKEITRISKRGYLEVPNGICESIVPFDSHLWFVYTDNNKLVFIRKSKKIHDILKVNGIKHHKILGKISDPFIRLYWDGKIDYEVIDTYSGKEKHHSSPLNNDDPHARGGGKWYLNLVKILRMFFYKSKNKEKLMSIIDKNQVYEGKI